MPNAIIWTAVSSQAQSAEDKISLSDQESRCREWCLANGYTVIDHLSVPGFSRSESDIITALEEFAAQGVFAYHKLRQHWQAKDFDLLCAYSHSRLGRSSTLHSWVVENVILSGAKIHLIQGGSIDQAGFRFQIALGGAASAGEIDTLKEKTRMGMIARVDRGLSMNEPPASHRLVRDPKTGQALRLEVREELRRLWDDLAAMVLDPEDIPWYRIEVELFERFGHVNPETGRKWSTRYFQRMLYNPFTWGTAAHGYTRKEGVWVFDETEPIPEGVIANRHPNPPVPALYTGDTAELMKLELRRRSEIKTGRTPLRPYRFTGLIVCGECGRIMSVNNTREEAWQIWRCIDRYKIDSRGCTNTKSVLGRIAEDRIRRYLDLWLRSKTPDQLPLSPDSPTQTAAQRAESIMRDLAALDRQVDSLIKRQIEAEENLRTNYAQLLSQLSARKAALERDLEQVQTKLESEAVRAQRRSVYESLQRIGLAGLWAQDARTINLTLYKMLGKSRFIALDGDIVDLR